MSLQLISIGLKLVCKIEYKNFIVTTQKVQISNTIKTATNGDLIANKLFLRDNLRFIC